MNRAVLGRILETFFRRWYLYSLVFLLACAAGLASISSTTKQYLSVGVISASRDTLLSGLSDVASRTQFSFDTPATFTSRTIAERMQTNEFALTVAERAGLRSALQTGTITLGEIRSSVSATAQGDNLLAVGAVHPNPEVAFRLASSTIESFIDAVVADDLSESAAAESFYRDVAEDYAVQVDDARASLTAYIRNNPAPSSGIRSESDQAEFDRLNAAVTRIETLYLDALSRSEDARLVAEQSRIDVEQRLRLVDAPELPVSPLSGIRASAMTMALFVALGTILTVAAVALVSFLDQSVRRLDEIEPRFGVPALAGVPTSRRPSRRRSRRRSSHNRRRRELDQRQWLPSLPPGTAVAVGDAGGEVIHEVDGQVAEPLRHLPEPVRRVDVLESSSRVPALDDAPTSRRSTRSRSNHDERRRKRDQRRRGRPVRSGTGVTVCDASGEVIHEVDGQVAEPLRFLLERLRLAGGVPGRLAVSSALSGEGVTFLGRSLATVLANDTDRRVCVVDLNWWVPSPAPTNGHGLGLSDVVLWDKPLDDVLIRTDHPSLWLLPAGQLDEDRRPMVAHDGRLEAVIYDLGSRFDHLVFDLPATLLTSDAMTMARLSEQVMLVVRQGTTTRSQVRSALAGLGAVPCAGIVLNGVRSKVPKLVRRFLGE